MQKLYLFRMLLLLFFTGSITAADAQGFTATGTIKEAVTGNPLTGVSVTIKGTKQVTTTDASGNFSIKPAGRTAVLVLNYVGFRTTEVTVTADKPTVAVMMEEEISPLKEVVITGLASSIKRSNRICTRPHRNHTNSNNRRSVVW